MKKKPYVANLEEGTVERLRLVSKSQNRPIQSLIREGIEHVLARYPVSVVEAPTPGQV